MLISFSISEMKRRLAALNIYVGSFLFESSFSLGFQLNCNVLFFKKKKKKSSLDNMKINQGLRTFFLNFPQY